MQDIIDPNRHSVWLATELQVEAVTAQEAIEQARDWLHAMLPSDGLSCKQGISVTRPAQSLTNIAVLAFQLLALKERSGTDAAWVHQLRTDIQKRLQQPANAGKDAL